VSSMNIYDAKTQLSKLVDQAAGGKDVVIARGGKPTARLTRLGVPKRELQFGVLKGKIGVAGDFDAALPDNVIAQFEGR
jgi:antitoxin (DNA-binding transcriptional repressor) of toxin-antitoxin stability system